MTELSRDVIVGVRPGLAARVARELNHRIRQYDCTVTIESDAGMIADARSLFALLTLGSKAGERVTVRADGPDAGSAIDEVVLVLEGRDCS